jgi:predicted PurR-regulated permease PerM
MLLTISVTVIAVIVVIVVLIQIPIILQIRRTAREIEKFFEIARTQIVPLSHDLTIISKEINSILQSIHRQLDRVEEGIHTFRDTAVRLQKLCNIGDLLPKLPALVLAVIRGIEAFVRMLLH